MKKALILFCSITGNTEKVARAIDAGLQDGGMQTTLLNYRDAAETDYLKYDLVCIGAPSYNWNVPAPFNEFLKKKFVQYRDSGQVKPGCPRIGKNALIFCTYSGPHTGIDEAVPAGLYMAQFLDHLGFDVVDQWYVLSEFIGNETLSTLGRMGDIRGLPSAADLQKIREKSCLLAQV